MRRYGRRGLRQPIAHAHRYVDGTQEAQDLGGDRSSCRGEEATSLDADGLLHLREERLIVELIQELEEERSLLPLVDEVEEVAFSDLNRVAKDVAHQLRRAVDLVLHTDVHLLPEAWDIAHHSRTHYGECLEDALRITKDRYLTAHTEAQVCPRFLKDMVQRQEAHRDISIRDKGVLHLMLIELLDEVAMM